MACWPQLLARDSSHGKELGPNNHRDPATEVPRRHATEGVVAMDVPLCHSGPRSPIPPPPPAASVTPTTSPHIREPESVQAPQRGISLPSASGLQARAPRRLSQAEIWLATLIPLIPIDRGLIPLHSIFPCLIPKVLPGKPVLSGKSAVAGNPARLCKPVPAPISAVQPSPLQQTRRPQQASPASCSGSASVPFSDPEA
jgi:hypothetical protein